MTTYSARWLCFFFSSEWCLFPLLSIIITFYILFGKMNLISGRLCHLNWPWLLVFSLLPKSAIFLLPVKGFHIIIYLDNILVIIHSKHAGKEGMILLCSLLVHLGLHINFSKSKFILTQHICFVSRFGLGFCVYMCISVISFLLSKANFSANGHS